MCCGLSYRKMAGLGVVRVVAIAQEEVERSSEKCAEEFCAALVEVSLAFSGQLGELFGGDGRVDRSAQHDSCGLFAVLGLLGLPEHLLHAGKQPFHGLKFSIRLPMVLEACTFNRPRTTLYSDMVLQCHLNIPSPLCRSDHCGRCPDCESSRF